MKSGRLFATVWLAWMIAGALIWTLPNAARADGDATYSPNDVGPRETPRDYTPFAQVETHRIRITNAVDGAVEVSMDAGKTWQLVGRVTAPATKSLMGYLASGYAPPGTIAAAAVHGLRIRVGDLNTAYPKLINILPREFAQTPVFFGGHIAGDSGIYTDIPAGTAIFRDLSPYAGNPVYLQAGAGILLDLPTNYQPAPGDIFVIKVMRPAVPLIEVDFPNRKNAPVTVKYADGVTKTVTTVLKPVYGTGRYDGTSYTGVGAINTSHTGVLTISTAPVSTSPLFEGTGPERRGGFQIQPSYHNSQSDEAWAPSVMVLGRKVKELQPDLEGTPPLFMGYFDLSWLPSDPDHSWRAQVRYGEPAPLARPLSPPGKGEHGKSSSTITQRSATSADHGTISATPRESDWEPMPMVIGTQDTALMRVREIRLVRNSYGDSQWLASRITAAVNGYQAQRLADARAGKIPVDRGRVTINAGSLDPRTRFVAFYIDGEFRGMTNSQPPSYVWNTNDCADGEHLVEIRQEDGDSDTIAAQRTFVWVDNANKIPVSPAASLPSQ